MISQFPSEHRKSKSQSYFFHLNSSSMNSAYNIVMCLFAYWSPGLSQLSLLFPSNSEIVCFISIHVTKYFFSVCGTWCFYATSESIKHTKLTRHLSFDTLDENVLSIVIIYNLTINYKHFKCLSGVHNMLWIYAAQ